MTQHENSESPEITSLSGNSAELAPIAAAKRIDAMDILRGVALVGILLMNIEFFGRSIYEIGSFDQSLTGIDHAFGWLIRCLVEGKFYKLFALLFGMGFAVMLIRAREVGKPFGAWFTRRMLVLFLIGMLHMIFVWGGDILHDYAFCGLLLLGWILLFQTKHLRKYDKPNTFLRIALIWMSFPFVASAVGGLAFGVGFDHEKFMAHWQEEQQIAALFEERIALPAEEKEASDESIDEPVEESDEEERELTKEERIEQAVSESVEGRREHDADVQNEILAYTKSSFWEATKHRFSDAVKRLAFTPFFSLIILMPVFMVGYWFVASGILRNHRDNRHIFKPMAIIGMTFGLFFSIGGLIIVQHPVSEQTEALQAVGGTMFFLGQYVLCAGYLGTLVLMLESPSWFRRLNRFAPMGRMALTNYIMQTTILAAIFHGYAGGFFGEISRAPQMLIVLAIIVFQLYFSAWWLNRYRFGPLEWLWRSMTYKSVQPMKIKS